MGLADYMTLPTLYCEIEADRIKCFSKFVHWDLLNEIPGRAYKGGGSDYVTLPLSWVSLVCLSNSFENLELGPLLHAWAEYFYTSVVEPCTLLRTGEGEGFITNDLLADIAMLMPPERSPINPKMRRYQVAAALLLATARRFILLDEQGTGKMTEVATTLALYPTTLPALIVSPGNTLHTWQRELALFGIESVILDGTPAQRRKMFDTFNPEEGGPQVMITTYGLVSKHSRVFGYGNIKLSDEQKQWKELNQIDWATVCADEAHRIKDPQSDQTRAMWGVSHQAVYRWALTGTPIEKSPKEMWALLHFVDPDAWSSSTVFQDRWVETKDTFYGVPEIVGMREDRIEEWRQVSEWMWRRKKLEGMPPVSREVAYCDLTGKTLKAYKDMEKQLMAEVGETDTVLFAQNHMVKAGRLRIMAQGPVEMETEIVDGKEVVSVTPVEKSPKLDLFVEKLADFAGTPVVCWFKSVPLMRMAEARLTTKKIPFVKIDGSMNNKARDNAGQAFQNGEVDVVLCSVSAASEGVTLTRAPARIIVDQDWSLIRNDQKDKRNERIGSEIHDELFEVLLITRNTIEEDQVTNRIEKAEMRDSIISPLAIS